MLSLEKGAGSDGDTLPAPIGVLECRGRDGQMQTMDFPIPSVPFCRRMMFPSKFLTLTLSETRAGTQQS